MGVILWSLGPTPPIAPWLPCHHSSHATTHVEELNEGSKPKQCLLSPGVQETKSPITLGVQWGLFWRRKAHNGMRQALWYLPLCRRVGGYRVTSSSLFTDPWQWGSKINGVLTTIVLLLRLKDLSVRFVAPKLALNPTGTLLWATR